MLGKWESLLIIIVLVILLLWFGLTFILRKKYPDNLVLAILLGSFLTPFGQFYIKKNAIWYFVGLVFLGFIISPIIHNGTYTFVILAIIGAILNYIRLKKK